MLVCAGPGVVGGKDKFADHPTASDAEAMSGFLHRSDVVANRPGLLVYAYAAAGSCLERARLDRLSANVLIGIFRGEIGRVSFRLAPRACTSAWTGLTSD